MKPWNETTVEEAQAELVRASIQPDENHLMRAALVFAWAQLTALHFLDGGKRRARILAIQDQFADYIEATDTILKMREERSSPERVDNLKNSLGQLLLRSRRDLSVMDLNALAAVLEVYDAACEEVDSRGPLNGVDRKRDRLATAVDVARKAIPSSSDVR